MKNKGIFSSEPVKIKKVQYFDFSQYPGLSNYMLKIYWAASVAILFSRIRALLPLRLRW